MVDVRFELTTNDPWSVDDAICEGISPLGYWRKVNPLLCATAVCKWSMLCYGGTAVLCYGGTAVDSSINSIGICAWHLCFE